MLHEAAEIAIETESANLFVNPLAHRSPLFQRRLDPEAFGLANGAIKGHPGHDLRVRKVTLFAADLPNAVIRFAPDFLQTLEQGKLQIQVQASASLVLE